MVWMVRGNDVEGLLEDEVMIFYYSFFVLCIVFGSCMFSLN